MTFTYTETLLTDRDKIRFAIRDVVSGSGPRPNNGNFSDAELAGLVSSEGNWQKAAAACFEALAAEYATLVDITTGPVRESLSQSAERYEKLAQTWRERHGSTGRAGVRQPTRIDGYSSTIASDEV